MSPHSALESAPGVEGELCFQFMKRAPGRLKTPGYFNTQVINKRIWIVDPAGRPWLSLGICHISYEGDHTDTGEAPYRDAVSRRHGDIETWAQAQAKRLRQWGFNTVGAWSSPQMNNQGLAYTVMLNASTYAGGDWLRNEFPDVFSPAFSAGVLQATVEKCVPCKDDPLLLG